MDNTTKATDNKHTTKAVDNTKLPVIADAKVNLSLDETFDVEELQGRRIYINEDVDDALITSVVFHILRYNRQDEGLPVEKRKPIVIFINSPGGVVADGFGVIDAMLTSKTPIYTVNLATCASMGLLIYLAGTVRFSMPHAQFLMHDGSTAGWDSTAKMKDRMEFETVQLEAMTREYILSRTDISEEFYKEKYRIEWYFLPKEGKEHGFVHKIIGSDCELDDIYS